MSAQPGFASGASTVPTAPSVPQPPPPLPPAPSPTPRWLRLLKSPLSIGAFIYGGLMLIDAGGTEEGAGFCVMRRCTGGYCPGCGATRATRHLTRGEIGASWHDHPWVLIMFLQAAVLTAWWGIARASGRVVDWLRITTGLLMFNAAGLVIVWVIRLANGSIPRFW